MKRHEFTLSACTERCHVRTQPDDDPLHARIRALPGTELASTLILNLTTFITMRNKCLLFQPTCQCFFICLFVFLQQPKLREYSNNFT